MIVVATTLGALWRRMWGGWFDPNSTLKRAVTAVLPFVLMYMHTNSLILCTIISICTLFAFLMPYHGFGIDMGASGKKPTWLCFIVMFFQYAGTSALAGACWHFYAPHSGGLFFMPVGCMVPIGYLIFSKLWYKFDWKPWGELPKGNWFIDGPACYGELVLGSSFIGGGPLCFTLAILFYGV